MMVTFNKISAQIFEHFIVLSPQLQRNLLMIVRISFQKHNQRRNNGSLNYIDHYSVSFFDQFLEGIFCCKSTEYFLFQFLISNHFTSY